MRLVVVGNGMVGHRLVELLVARGAHERCDIVVFGDERQPAYDRVHLSELFAGRDAAGLALAEPDYYARHGVAIHLGDRVVAIDRANHTVRSARGRIVSYDKLVLATGSSPFIPPVPGADGPSCLPYRTIDDVEAIRARAHTLPAGAVGAVIGGGLLGLEAANALRNLGLETHVVELAPRLMSVQLDDAGGAMLRRIVASLGVHVHLGAQTRSIDPDGRLRFADGTDLAARLVVFSAGIRPRDELARDGVLAMGARGGIAVDDYCRTSDRDIYAIGECAAWNDRCFGLVGPGYQMAEIAADHVLGAWDRRFRGADMSTKLKLLGVDVASFGDAHGTTDGARSCSFIDERAGVYKKLVLDADGERLLGGILVGDAADYGPLALLASSGAALPARPESLLFELPTAGSLPAEAIVCSCNNVSVGALCAAIDGGACDLAALADCTRAGTGCGGCAPTVKQLLDSELAARGIERSTALCEHFALSRQELYDLVRVAELRSFDAVLARAGRGRGCEICKPAVASILASCWNEHVIAEPHAHLQDTNDAFLANIQRDGTYSVVPRVPGGEITPDKLIAIGAVAKKYDLYTKITGGQRIDLFGARLEQLPAIWAELIAAGFESGHAYGKAMRTVKTCVGSTWCRYGVQDSVGLGVRLEHRYKGVRAPHKLKLAVSGCTRECAEAQSKDVGVIATEAGYNLYVCGNGGTRPRHADLLATDLDEPTLIKLIDRFLMFYIKTADRLQRTARWLESLDGGLDYLRQVVCDDSLGIAHELEAQMQALVASYQCEWRAALGDERALQRFRTFVNHEGQDDSLEYVRERGQRRPAYPHERLHLRVVS